MKVHILIVLIVLLKFFVNDVGSLLLICRLFTVLQCLWLINQCFVDNRLTLQLIASFQLQDIKGMVTGVTGLESTSLLFVYGTDLYFTRVSK